MIMTDEEIVRHYRQAKDQKGSIQILADLNATGNDEIRAVLEKAGEIQPAEPNSEKEKQPTRGRQFNEQLARQLYERGLIDKDIADQVGVAHCTIFQWRKKNDLPANNPHRGGGRKESRRVKKIMETQPTAERAEDAQTSTQLVNPVLVRIQKILDMVSPEDSAKVSGQYLDLMITMLTDEVQRIINAKKPLPGEQTGKSGEVKPQSK